MKFLVVVFFALAAFVATAVGVPAAAYDGPIYDGPTYELTRIEDVDTDGGLATSTDEAPIRHRRVTCDVLSFSTLWVSPNSAACAAKCLAQRRKGGYCDNGVCRCR